MKKMFATILITVFCILALSAAEAYAAVGCTLNDPDRDIKRIFPEKAGFEPAAGGTYTELANRRRKPLGHLSNAGRIC